MRKKDHQCRPFIDLEIGWPWTGTAVVQASRSAYADARNEIALSVN